HGAGLGQRAGDRFLARHILAGLDGGHGHRGVHEVGRHDVDQVDLGQPDRILPVRRCVDPAPVIGEDLGMLLPAPARRVHDRADRGLEEPGDLRPGIRMGPPHEALADHRHVDLTHREAPRSLKKPQTKRGLRRRHHSLKWLCGHYSRAVSPLQGSSYLAAVYGLVYTRGTDSGAPCPAPMSSGTLSMRALAIRSIFLGQLITLAGLWATTASEGSTHTAHRSL